MSKVKEKWKAYLDQVPGMPVKIAASAEELTDDSQAMLELHNALPAPLSDRLSSCVEPTEDTPWELLVEHRWCLCEMAEGDYPRVYVFPTLDRLVEGIAKREGQDPEYMAGKSYYEEGYIESDSFTNDPDMEEGGELETD